jgi:hypothetical protein
MSRRTFRRPSASMLVAMIAVVLACGGTATAAKKLLGSADIKNNSLTTSDVKNGTLGTTDLSAAAKKSLKGNAGAKGATGAAGTAGAPGAKGDQGAQGIQGVQGPIGPSNVFVASDDSEFVDEAVSDSDILLTKTIPVGKYSFVAKLSLMDDSGGNAGDPKCSVGRMFGLFAEAPPLDTIDAHVTSSATQRVPVMLAGTFDQTDAVPVVLRCVTEAASNQDQLSARDIKLVVTQTGAIG